MQPGRAASIVLFLYCVALGVAAVHIANGSYAPWPDEMWGYNLSVNVYRNEAPNSILTACVNQRCFPYISGNYQGIFKGYLHLLFLLVTGGAAEFQRYISFVLFAALGLAMGWAIRPVARSWMAAIPMVIAASDLNYIAFMPSDQGPFLLQNLFTALGFGFLLRAALSGRTRDLVAALLFSSAIVGDKLTGLPVAVAIIAMCGLVTLRWRHMLTRDRLLVYLAALALPVLPYVVFIARGGLSSMLGMIGSTPDTLGERIARLAEFFGQIVGGSYSYLLSSVYRTGPFFGFAHCHLAVMALALIMVCACLVDVRSRQIVAARALLFLLAITAITAALFVCIPGLGRPWNYLVFNPLIYLAMALVIVWTVERVQSVAPRARYAFSVCLCAVLLINLAIAQTNVIRELAYQATHRGKDLTSMAIYPLMSELKARGIDRVVCLDYGPCWQIYILTAGRIAIDDFAFSSDFDREPLPRVLRRRNTALLLRTIRDVEDPSWSARLQAGTIWFENPNRQAQEQFPVFDRVPLPRIDDTQYTLVLPHS